VYLIFGAAGTLLVGFLVGPVTGQWVGTALLLAFAVEFPEYEVLLLALPVKVKWLGLLSGGYMLWQFASGGLQTRAAIGVALGDFLLEAKASGWDVEGVEISAFAAQQARARGLRVTTGRLEELDLPAASFDVITLYDSVEHFTDPVATLAAVRRLLAPGGIVHLVTPNVGGLQARLLGRLWYHYKPGEHLFYFAPRTLRATLEDAGFADIVRCAYGESTHAELRGLERHEKSPDYGDLSHILIVEASGRGGSPPKYLAGPRSEFLRDLTVK